MIPRQAARKIGAEGGDLRRGNLFAPSIEISGGPQKLVFGAGIPTDEELMIASDTAAIVSGK